VLLARVRARTRPADASRSGHFRFADLTIDFAARSVARAGRELRLTRTEFALLECLAKSAGRIVTRDRLLDAVWGDREVGSNNLEVFINFLRRKVDAPGNRKLIQTERGVGYSLRDET
jgi:DNA-binding response OmpR family regulator